MNALDLGNTSSCWNSEGSDDQSPQWIQLDFGRQVLPRQLRLQFQAGFSAESCVVQTKVECSEASGGSSWTTVETFELCDAHEVQVCRIQEPRTELVCSSLRLVFEDFTDFYGRITIYQLEILGDERSGQ
jgi:F5/8 type C domain